MLTQLRQVEDLKILRLFDSDNIFKLRPHQKISFRRWRETGDEVDGIQEEGDRLIYIDTDGLPMEFAVDNRKQFFKRVKDQGWSSRRGIQWDLPNVKKISMSNAKDIVFKDTKKKLSRKQRLEFHRWALSMRRERPIVIYGDNVNYFTSMIPRRIVISNIATLRGAKISDVLVDDYPLMPYQEEAFQKWQAGEETDMIVEEGDQLLYIKSRGQGTMKFSVADRAETNVKRRKVVFAEEEEEEEMEVEALEVKEYDSVVNTIKTTMNQDRLGWLKRILSIYTFPFLSNNTMDVVKSVLESDSAYKTVKDSMRVVVYDKGTKKTGNANKAIRDAMWCRYPVYFGHPVDHMYKDKLVKKYLGYVPGNREIDGQIRYTICGLAFTDRRKLIGVVHPWGINLESIDTSDYKHYLSTDGKLRVDKYKKTLHKMFLSIIHGALRLLENIPNKNKVHLRLPLIGLGAFMTTLNYKQKQAARRAFKAALDSALDTYAEEQIDVYLLDYDNTIRNFATDHSNLHVLHGGDVFKFDDEIDDLVVLTNAFDSNSFIGNGGMLDDTIDGFLVAGNGSGESLPNSSYLHNPFFVPEIMDPSRWEFI